MLVFYVKDWKESTYLFIGFKFMNSYVSIELTLRVKFGEFRLEIKGSDGM